MKTNVALYAKGAEIACRRCNCGAASALQLYRHCSRKEGPTGLVMLQDVPKVNRSKTFSFPHRLARGAGELEDS